MYRASAELKLPPRPKTTSSAPEYTVGVATERSTTQLLPSSAVAAADTSIDFLS